jgi:thioredoxin-related protein
MFTRCLLLFISLSFILACISQSSTQIQWLNWQTWNEKAALADKKGLVWLHSPTCDACLDMKNNTFTNPHIIQFINAHFYAIQLNVYEEADIVTKGKTWRYVSDLNGNTYHELAAALSADKQKVPYPSIAFLDEKFDLIVPIPQQLDVQDLTLLLHFVQREAYKTQSINDFKRTFNPPNL